MQVLKGAYDAYLGKRLDLTVEKKNGAVPDKAAGAAGYEAQAKRRKLSSVTATEFIIMLNKVLISRQRWIQGVSGSLLEILS